MSLRKRQEIQELLHAEIASLQRDYRVLINPRQRLLREPFCFLSVVNDRAGQRSIAICGYLPAQTNLFQIAGDAV